MASLVAENYLEATIQSSIFPASGHSSAPMPRRDNTNHSIVHCSGAPQQQIPPDTTLCSREVIDNQLSQNPATG